MVDQATPGSVLNLTFRLLSIFATEHYLTMVTMPDFINELIAIV